MVVKWKKEARLQLKDIHHYYCIVANRKVALRITEQIRNTVRLLPTHPYLGHIEDSLIIYRSIVAHAHYKVIYRVDNQVIHIVAIWDCRQDPQRMEELR